MKIEERCEHFIDLLEKLPDDVTCGVLTNEEKNQYIAEKDQKRSRRETKRMERLRNRLLNLLETLENDYGDNYLDCVINEPGPQIWNENVDL